MHLLRQAYLQQLTAVSSCTQPGSSVRHSFVLMFVACRSACFAWTAPAGQSFWTLLLRQAQLPQFRAMISRTQPCTTVAGLLKGLVRLFACSLWACCDFPHRAMLLVCHASAAVLMKTSFQRCSEQCQS